MTLTREQIKAMEAGRELDVLVLERVLGFSQQTGFDYTTEKDTIFWVGAWDMKPRRFFKPMIPHFSTDISAAWQVVEKLQEEPLEFYFGINRTTAIPFHKTGKPHWHVEFGACFSYADTAPLAICRAALLALSTTP